MLGCADAHTHTTQTHITSVMPASGAGTIPVLSRATVRVSCCPSDGSGTSLAAKPSGNVDKVTGDFTVFCSPSSVGILMESFGLPDSSSYSTQQQSNISYHIFI